MPPQPKERGHPPPRGTAELQSLWAGQSRAGPGRARQVQMLNRCCFLLRITVHVCCTMRCPGGHKLQTPMEKQDALYGSRMLGSVPFPWCPQGCAPAHPASVLCREENQSSGHSLSSKHAPAACQHWGGRIHPWGASFSVLLMPTDSASDSNNSLTQINGDVYTRGSTKGRSQSDVGGSSAPPA